MMRSLRNKLRSELGESLVETAASLLVVSFAMLMLAGSVVSSGQLNKEAREADSLLVQDASKVELADPSVELKYDGFNDSRVSVNLYEAGGMYYYEPKSSGVGA